MKKTNYTGLFTALSMLFAFSAQAASLYSEDFYNLAHSEADGKVVPATEEDMAVIAATPGTWYKNAFGSFFAHSNADNAASRAPDDCEDGAGLRVGYWNHNTNYVRTATINTGVLYDMNTNYTISIRAKIFPKDGSVPNGTEQGQIQLSTGYWTGTNMVWVKGANFPELSATAWTTNSVVSNGARISTNAYGRPIIIRLTRKAANSANYFSWVDWVRIDGIDPYVDWATSEGLSSMERTADEDGDGVDNFTEWANGGNPADPGDTGLSTPGFIVDVSGTNRFAFVTPRQVDYWPNGVDYYLESSDSLNSGNWANADSWVSGIDKEGFNADFDAVTNLVGNVESNDIRFLRLRVSHPDYNP